MSRRLTIAGAAAGWLLCAVSFPGRSAAEAPTARPASEEAVAQLRQEVLDLRQMLIQAMQIEQQHYDLLLKLVQSGSAGDKNAAGPRLPSSPPALPAANLANVTRPAAGAPASSGEGPAPVRFATVTGQVETEGAPPEQPVFVFIEDLRGPPARGSTIEIAQKGKQFTPQVSVVPVGTRAIFPNLDPVFHNAFSLSRGNAFDVSLKAGHRGNPVLLGRPGVVEVYCDIHARMWAEILVTRNNHVTRVGPGGKFTLENVPVGQRVVAAWTAGAVPVKRTVDLGGSGAKADFSLKVSPRRAHNNKLGQPYGSYEE
jgi:plastocyanin